MKAIKNWKQRIFTLILTVMTFITAIPVLPVHAMDFSEQFYGGYDIAWEELNVYSSPQWTTRIGKIYKFEGFTVLRQNGPEGYLWVEYSTSNGAKRGYVQIPQDELGGRGDGLGKVTANSTVYYGRTDRTGKYGSYQSTGTVYAGEIVAIIAKNDDWAYIEYNTNSGRKRGYMSYSNLYVYNRPGIFPDFYNHEKSGTTTYVSGRRYVYAGPSSRYVQIGWVENENITVFGDECVIDGSNNQYWSQYIEYQS